MQSIFEIEASRFFMAHLRHFRRKLKCEAKAVFSITAGMNNTGLYFKYFNNLISKYEF